MREGVVGKGGRVVSLSSQELGCNTVHCQRDTKALSDVVRGIGPTKQSLCTCWRN